VIVFGDDSPMIPHITLATGYLISPHTIEDLARVAQRLAQRVQPLTLKLRQPYLEPVHEGYVLCDVEENQDFQTLTKLVSETTRGAFPLMRDVRSIRRAHITLAHIDAQYDEVYTYLQSVKVIPQVVCSHLEIAHCGQHGTCIDRLYGCDLAPANEHTGDLPAHQMYRVDALWRSTS
jgi:2'-5' RNA ligase